MPSQYISTQQFEWLLSDLNINESSAQKKDEILVRAVADLEADLSQKFIVPLINANNSPFSTCQEFAKNKILSALKAKIREIIGFEKNRNLTGTIDSNEKFINVHGIEYTQQIKGLLNPNIVYGFKLQQQAESSQSPVQLIGLARANNSTSTEDDPYL